MRLMWKICLLQMSYMGDEQLFTAVHLQTMLLTKLKQTAEVALKTKVVDAVISVSSFSLLFEIWVN